MSIRCSWAVPKRWRSRVQIEGERARLKQVEAELAGQESRRGVPRAVDGVSPLRPLSDPAARTPSTGKPGAGTGRSEEPQELRLRSEMLDPFVNPVYEILSRDVADARSRLVGLERQRQELVDRLKLDAPTAEKLNRLYEAEAELARLTREHDLARASYLSAATKHEEARLQITMRSARLQVLDRALPPDRPVAPRSVRNTFAATLIALTVGIIAVLAWDSRRRPAAA